MNDISYSDGPEDHADVAPPPHAEGDAPDDASVLLVDDTPANLDVLVDYLSSSGFDILVATNGERALERAQQAKPDLILLDVMMPGIDGFETCRRLKADPETAEIPVIFMTALSDETDKVRGFRAGGVDYITKPIQHAEVLARIHTHLALRRLQKELAETNASLEERVAERTRRLAEQKQELEAALDENERLRKQLQQENTILREELDANRPYGDIIGTSPEMQNIVKQIEVVAPTDASVLILGESGTGKELVAREVHDRSDRADKPIVRVNCATVPRELYESEFFGHVKGAFTGAVKDRQGRFAAADGGTLFLDEVGEIPLDLQSKLLRVLQEGTYERVGDERTREVDVRIIAATNRDLKACVDEGTFREDLYYRLNVFPITVPPLRERIEDVPLLAAHFVERACQRFGLGDECPQLSEADVARLESHTWPGNVRELENAVERAVIIARSTGRLQFQLPGQGDSGVSAPARSGLVGSEASAVAQGERILTESEVETLLKANIENALDASDGRIRGEGGAAELLDVKPTTLASRIKRYGIDRNG